MDAWAAAIEFLLVDDRAVTLAGAHPRQTDGRCDTCKTTGCAAADLACAALSLIAECPTHPSWAAQPPVRGSR